MLELVEDFAALCEAMPKAQPYILVVDDLDRYDQSALPATYDRIAKTERSRLIGSIEWRNLSGYTQNSMLLELRREPTMLILQPDSAGDVLQMTGVRAQLRPGLPMAAGRGILIAHRQPTLLQVASATDADDRGGGTLGWRRGNRAERHLVSDPMNAPAARRTRHRTRALALAGVLGLLATGLATAAAAASPAAAPTDSSTPGSSVPESSAPDTSAPDTSSPMHPPETSEPVITAPTPDPSASFQPAAIEWSMDAFGEGVDEGHLEVPIDYANPDAGTFTLYLTRHRATGDRVGSLLVNPGGPRNRGQRLRHLRRPDLRAAAARCVRHHRLGPRGTGLSTPAIDCIDDYDHYFTGVDITPDDQAERDEIVDLAKDFTDSASRRTRTSSSSSVPTTRPVTWTRSARRSARTRSATSGSATGRSSAHVGDVFVPTELEDVLVGEVLGEVDDLVALGLVMRVMSMPVK